jgi:hypothetical protein
MRTINYRFYTGKSGNIPVDYEFEVKDEDIFYVIYMDEYADVLSFEEGQEHFEDLPYNLQEIIIEAYWETIEETYQKDAYRKFLEDKNLRKNFAH